MEYTPCTIKRIVRRKQTSAYKLVQLSSFTGFCWCCWLAILKYVTCLIFFANDDVRQKLRHNLLFFTAQRRRSICSSSRHFLPPSLWPSNSPDLNPVNYKIWGLLQQRVYSRKIQKVDELQQRIVEEYGIGNAWSSAWSTTHYAVKQWRRRLCSCVAAKGGHFEQNVVMCQSDSISSIAWQL